MDFSPEHKPYYNVFSGSHCTIWALNALKAAGVTTDDSLIPSMRSNGDYVVDAFKAFAWSPYTQALNLAVRDAFQRAQRALPRRDPLVLDLDGDGIETVSAPGTQPILFDHDGSGVKAGTGWISADDGFLRSVG